MYEFVVDDIPVTVYFSRHASIRLHERNVNFYAACASIASVGEDILDLKHGDEFAVLDKDLDISIVCGLHARGTSIEVEVITVYHSADFYVHSGTHVLRSK